MGAVAARCIGGPSPARPRGPGGAGTRPASRCPPWAHRVGELGPPPSSCWPERDGLLPGPRRSRQEGRSAAGYTRWPSSNRRIARCSVQRDVQLPMSWQYQRVSAHPETPSATMSDVGWRVPHSQHHALPLAASRGPSSGPLGVLTGLSLITVIAAVCPKVQVSANPGLCAALVRPRGAPHQRTARGGSSPRPLSATGLARLQSWPSIPRTSPCRWQWSYAKFSTTYSAARTREKGSRTRPSRLPSAHPPGERVRPQWAGCGGLARSPAKPPVGDARACSRRGAGHCGPVGRRRHRASMAAVTLSAAASRRAVPMSSRTSSRAAGIAAASASPLPTGKNGSARPCTTSVGSVSSPRR